jgi:hypothetical protein
MAAMKARFEDLLDGAKADLDRLKVKAEALFGHEDPRVHRVAREIAATTAKVTSAVTELRGDEAAVEHEAEAGAERDAVNAEKPGAEGAAADAAHLGGEAAGDAKKAL